MDAKIQSAAIKTVLTGLAGYYVCGTRIGFGAAIAQAGLSTLAKNPNQKSWLVPGDSFAQGLAQLRGRVKGIVIFQSGMAMVVLIAGPIIKQVGIRNLRLAFRRGYLEAIRAVAHICIFTPVAEEIVFRGFIQEAVQTVQSELRGNQPVHQDELKLRIRLQAVLFGLVHYSQCQGWSNGYIVPANVLIGWALGSYKEKYGIHASMLSHSAQNSLITARVALVGG